VVYEEHGESKGGVDGTERMREGKDRREGKRDAIGITRRKGWVKELEGS